MAYEDQDDEQRAENQRRSRTKADRIARLRERLRNRTVSLPSDDVLRGILDLLADEL